MRVCVCFVSYEGEKKGRDLMFCESEPIKTVRVTESERPFFCPHHYSDVSWAMCQARFS